MKLPILLLAPLALAVIPPAAARAQGSACQGPPGAATLYVNVEGLHSSKGLVAVTLYADDKSKFLVKHGSIYVGRVDAQAPVTRVCMHIPANGIYALAVYHDEDGNRHLKRTLIGAPAEGFGFSNNPSTFFGLPAFSKVRLRVDKPVGETTIRLRYP